MSSKDWLDRAVSKPTSTTQEDAPAGRRTGLVAMLQNLQKAKTQKEKG
jgi:hypothetical protein